MSRITGKQTRWTGPIESVVRVGLCFSFSVFCLLFVGCQRKAESTDRAEPAVADDSRSVLSASIAPVQSDGQSVSRPVSYLDQPTETDSILIGIDADMTSASARSGQAIYRGVMLAVAEINQQGGVLERSLEVVARNHRGNPARGIDNINELADLDRLVAIVGGSHTPVALEELAAIHKRPVIYLSPWAAGTPLVDNGYQPNFVFRVSVRDEYAGEFLVDSAVQAGHTKIALLLERTAWGRSNEKAMVAAIRARQMQAVAVGWFNWGEPSLVPEVQRIAEAGADVVLLVANPLEGALALRAIADLPVVKRPAVLSHWGITGGDFHSLAKEALPLVDLAFLQTYSFLQPNIDTRGQALVKGYCQSYDDASQAADIFSPTGTAHAYDMVHLLAAAIRNAGKTDRAAVRDALESIEDYQGLVRHYAPPFRPQHHDALTAEDYHLARFGDDGVIRWTATAKQPEASMNKAKSGQPR